VLGGIAKIGAGFALGGPAGALGAATTVLKVKPSSGAVTVPYAPMNLAPPPPAPRTTVSLFPPKVETYYPPVLPISNYPVPPAAPSGGGAAAPGVPWARPRATHPNKSTYVTRGGGTSRWPASLLLHPKGTEMVTTRRMNPGNGKAAKHAVRRLVAFYRLSNQVAKQLRRAASRAGINRGRGARRQLGRGSVEVVNVE
jgi:hypothetical protein